MLRQMPVARLACQLVPAALVAAVGVHALSNLTRTSEPVTSAAPVQTAITAEAVFTATPRETAEPPAVKQAAARPAVTTKPVTVASTAPLPPRKPVAEPAPRQVASAPAPLPTTQLVELPIAPAPLPPDTTMIGRMWSATTSVAQLPVSAVHSVTRSVTGWFQDSLPPRPPAAVPQNFQAEM